MMNNLGNLTTVVRTATFGIILFNIVPKNELPTLGYLTFVLTRNLLIFTIALPQAD